MTNFSSKLPLKQKYLLYELKIQYTKDITLQSYVNLFESLFTYPPAEIYAMVHFLIKNGEFRLSNIPRDLGLALCQKIDMVLKETKQKVKFSLLTQ